MQQIATVLQEVPTPVYQQLVQDAEKVVVNMNESTSQFVVKICAITFCATFLLAAMVMCAIVFRDGNTPLVTDMSGKLDQLLTVGLGSLVALVTGKTVQHIMTAK